MCAIAIRSGRLGGGADPGRQQATQMATGCVRSRYHEGGLLGRCGWVNTAKSTGDARFLCDSIVSEVWPYGYMRPISAEESLLLSRVVHQALIVMS